jgi:hypothetical protein
VSNQQIDVTITRPTVDAAGLAEVNNPGGPSTFHIVPSQAMTAVVEYLRELGLLWNTAGMRGEGES